MLANTAKSVILAVAVTFGCAMPALAGDALDRAIYAAVEQQKETKKVSTYDDHQFNIKPMAITSRGANKGFEVKGQLSHHLSWRSDDQYFYEITIDDAGTILQMEENIDRGGWTSTLLKLPVGKLVEGLTGGSVPPAATESAIDTAGRWLGGQLDGSWEGAARKVVIQVGLQVAAANRLTPTASAARIAEATTSGPAVRDHRRPQVSQGNRVRDHRDTGANRIRDHRSPANAQVLGGQ